MKKNNIQKCISWCEKHDIQSIKLSFSNNIFLSNVYEDGTPVSTSRSNNSFLKKKNSTYTNTTSHAATASNNVIYVSPNDTLNAIEVGVEVGGGNIVNKVEQVESIIETIDPVDNKNE